MALSWTVAKDVLSQTEKDRICCVQLNTVNGVIDWGKASTEFGAASSDSMRVMYRSAIKKIKDAGGADANATPTNDSPMKATPKGRRKRKIDDDSIQKFTPKKPRGNKKTQAGNKEEPAEGDAV
ncbi:hypothetical protein LTR28_008766, partial [Elasticomyces elasticus]